MDKNHLFVFLLVIFHALLGSALRLSDNREVGAKCRHVNGDAGTCQPRTNCTSDNTVCGTAAGIALCCISKIEEPDSHRTPAPATLEIVTPRYDSNLNKRISLRKCEEYSAFAQDNITAMTLSTIPQFIHRVVPNCNFNDTTDTHTAVEKGEIPHMVQIFWVKQQRSGFVCAGSLISEKYVLTAASYLKKTQDYVAWFGPEEDVLSISIRVKNVIPHFDFNTVNYYNDVALVELEKPVKLTPSIRPACLWNQEGFTSNRSIAAGWELDDNNNLNLMKSLVPTLRKGECEKKFFTLFPKLAVKNKRPDILLCAGETSDLNDSWQCIRGGPLHLFNEQNSCIFNIIGVARCFEGRPDVKGLYTRISKYVDWIEEVAWDARRRDRVRT